MRGKRILVYENSSGLSFYTYKVCNSILESNPDIIITYMTEKNNNSLDNLSSKVELLKILDGFDKNVKKDGFIWIVNRIFVSIKNLMKRNNYIRSKKYDVVSVQWTVPIIDQFLIKMINKKNHIVLTVHDVVPPTKSKYWSMGSLNRLYHNVDALVVHTQSNKQQLVEMFNIEEDKIIISCIGVDKKPDIVDKSECRSRFGLSNEKKVVLFYGSIREQKGLDNLICALEGINDCQLLIAGNMPFGDSFDRYQKLIEHNKIDCIKFIKFIPDEWTTYLFSACDFVCLPYKYFFSQSGVLMQCIQYHKPVVISDVASFREIVEKFKIGLLCKPNDIYDLHSQVGQMIKILNKKCISFDRNFDIASEVNSWAKCALQYTKALGI